MLKNIPSQRFRIPGPEPLIRPSVSRFSLRELLVLVLFVLLTVVMLFPLSINLWRMVPEPTDPLLNVWRMQWNGRAFLSGPAGIANLFNTNIFYPFPLTLAYSEHFLMESALALPFLLIAPSHLFGLNVSVLFTFILSGYAMYLLTTDWTGYRWAGLVAGIVFAFSPQRFGQLNHLELLVTQWMPLTLLALHWTLTRPGWRYAFLLGLFLNVQLLSGFHYGFNLILACTLLALIYTLAGCVCWRWGLVVAAGLTVLVTLLLNGPVWLTYLRFSDIMGAVRTPGEVRVYSAVLTDYLTTIPYNLLYGWTFGRWPASDHQFQPLMPIGVTGLLLALVSLGLLIYNLRLQLGKNQASAATPLHSLRFSLHASHPALHSPRRSYIVPALIFLLLLTLLALLLSFGLNETALGTGLAPLLKFSPYFWLYEHVSFLQGIRVPGRFSILAVIGLAGLVGWGTAALFKLVALKGQRPWLRPAMASGLAVLVLLESWSAPLAGPKFPAGDEIPPVYAWLRRETPANSVVLELPFQNGSEFLYEYFSSYHWRRLANGGTGFTPPIYKDLRQWLAAFPDTRSVDVIQQLGINQIILHPAGYTPEAWQRVWNDLPLYLPAFERIDQVGEDLVLQVARPTCLARPEAVTVTLAPGAELDGLVNAMAVTYRNAGPAAWVADAAQVSTLTFSSGTVKNFTEPLVVPAGEAQSVVVPLGSGQPASSLTGAQLASLGRTVTAGGETPSPEPERPPAWQPLGLKFADGPDLVAYDLGAEIPTACDSLEVALKWQGGQAGDRAIVQLLDPFGRLVLENTAQPWTGNGGESLDQRSLLLPGSLPPGRYGLRIRVRTADGQERLPVTDAGVTIPPDRIPPLPVTLHPLPLPVKTGGPALATLGGTVKLLGAQLARPEVAPGNWLRLTLVWQATEPIEAELTVFTQLLGPDGRVWGQQDHPPKGGWYETPLWQPGQPITDDYAFPVDAAAPAGTYRLIAGLYDSQSQVRLPVQTPAGPGDFVDLGPVQVVGP